MSRRFILLFVFAAALIPSATSAASWHQYTNANLGFSLSYPAAWHVTPGEQLGVKQVMLTYQGKQIYSMTVAVLPVKGGSSSRVTISRFIHFEAQHAGNAQYGQVHWNSVKVGGKSGSGGVFSPSTEGGVALSQGIYVIPWHSHLYEITVATYASRSFTRLSQFPTVYGQMLQSWRFR